MVALKLILLGGFQIHAVDGVALAPITVKKAKALLAYLALTPGQIYSRDRLATLLWEDSNDAQARHSLRQALTSLRKVLSHQVLLADADTLIIAPGTIDIDVFTFEQTQDSSDPEALERALALYRGEFLEGFNPRAPAFEDWLMAQRSRLQQHALALMSRLLDHYLATGADQRATELAIRLLVLDPLRESVQRTLMWLYAKQGHYGAALKQYRVCQTVLRRELGIAPEPETDQLYRDIAVQRRDPSRLNTSAQAFIPPRPQRTTPQREQSIFVGRYPERQQFVGALDACLETGCRGQSFLLRGEAGIGKTQLVQELSVLAADRGFVCHQAQALEFGAVSVRGVIPTLVRGLLDLSVNVDTDQARAAAEQFFSDDSGEPEQLLFLYDLLGLPQPAALQTLFNAMDNAVRRCEPANPVGLAG